MNGIPKTLCLMTAALVGLCLCQVSNAAGKQPEVPLNPQDEKLFAGYT
ncbi:MAG: hypothetical protein ACI8XO_004717 [Verrucomicrobiales bacterium]|jgi:hypothetical protein